MTRWPWPNARATLHSVAAIARHEFRMTLRERAGWGGITAACAIAFADSAFKPHWPMVSGIRASAFGVSFVLPPLILIILAGAARRDQAASASDVIESRPYPAHILLLARFLGDYAAVLLGYALMILCGLAAPLLLAGRWPPLLTPIHSFVRGIVPLLYVSALAYCSVALARNVLAAGVVAAYWLFVFLWGDFLARIFNFSLTQNWPTYLLIGVAILCGTMAIRHWSARESGSGRRLLGLGAVILLVLGIGDACLRVWLTDDPPLHRDPIAVHMAGQHIDGSPRVPGFWLPDQDGRPFRISSTDSRVLVILFWSPHRPESMTALAALRRVARELPEDQATCIAVCLSDDHAISPHVAAQGRYSFPMVTDTATHFSRAVEDSSPLAEAYVAETVPLVLITDRVRRQVSVLKTRDTEDAEILVAEARRALAVPVPPS